MEVCGGWCCEVVEVFGPQEHDLAVGRGDFTREFG